MKIKYFTPILALLIVAACQPVNPPPTPPALLGATDPVIAAIVTPAQLAADIAVLEQTASKYDATTTQPSKALTVADNKVNAANTAILAILPGPTPPPINTKPSATNTGANDGKPHTTSPGITITKTGASYDHVTFTGMVNVKSHGVTFTQCTFDVNNATYCSQIVTPSGTAADPSGPSATYSYCTFTDAAADGVFGSNYTADRCYVHSMNSDAFGGAWNVKITNNYVHDIGLSPTAHSDGFQSVGGQNLAITGNNFDIPYWYRDSSGNIHKSNSCLMLGPTNNPIANVTISGNWFNGGNYSIYCAGCTMINITKNIFDSTGWQWGAVYQGSSTATSWNQNVDQNGNPIP